MVTQWQSYMILFIYFVAALPPKVQRILDPGAIASRIIVEPNWEQIQSEDSELGCDWRFAEWKKSELNQTLEIPRYPEDPCVESDAARTMSKDDFSMLGLQVATQAIWVLEGQLFEHIRITYNRVS